MDENDKKEQEAIYKKLVDLIKILYEQGSRTVENEHRILSLIETMTRQSNETTKEIKQQSELTQRNVDFIIQQQAQFAADMQQLRDSQARSEQKWERTAEGITALLAIAEIHEREIVELRQTQVETQARTDAQMAETGERLNALINTVERIISERRNGGGKTQEGSE
jgi:hypothetical protein